MSALKKYLKVQNINRFRYTTLATKDGSVDSGVKLGRFSSNLKLGIVGLPNVGKSSLFNALTKSSVPAENFPFCTIEPNESKVIVNDKRFDNLVQNYQPKKSSPATLSITDIAGLVEGASKGLGLGNEFLNSIRNVDALYHVCRYYENNDIHHVEGSINPTRDRSIIELELKIKDLEYLDNFKLGLEKSIKKSFCKEKALELDIINKLIDFVGNKDLEIRKGSWDNQEIELINKVNLITAKPVIYLINVDQDTIYNKDTKNIDKFIQENEIVDKVIPFCAPLELELAQLKNDERQEFLKELELECSLDKIVHQGYRSLDLIHYFTVGKDEVKAWTIKDGFLAPQAAGIIHTDFEKGFISSDVIHYSDFLEHKEESVLKKLGKVYQKGKLYQVLDGDILHFKFKAAKK